jgi:MFS transporter, SP family, arabinose:H+ symporter
MKNTSFVLLSTFAAALGGLLFGFDSSVISGALKSIQPFFQLDEVGVGFSVSSAVIGCAIGAGTAGYMSDLIGRKTMLLITAVLFAVSSIGTAIPDSFTVFVIFRVLCGISIGAVSVLSPTYIAEIAPAKIRGQLVSLNQLMIVIGILVAYFSNFLIQKNGLGDWRIMLGVGAAPAVLFFIALLFAPESPRWLMKKGRKEEAEKILAKIGSRGSAAEMAEMSHGIDDEKVPISDLFKGKMATVFTLGLVLACLQQLVGINAVIYYAPTIFAKTGGDEFFQTVMVGCVNLTFTFVAIWLIDKVGRKPLMIYGSVGMGVSLLLLVYAFVSDQLAGNMVLFSILGYIASFAASLAPITWVVVTELFPNKIRGTAMSVAIAAHWSCTFLVTQTFPYILEKIGGQYAFGIFALISFFTLFFAWKYIPETKGKTLEQIQKELGVA